MKKLMNFRFFLCLALTMIVSTIVSVKVFVMQKSKLIFLAAISFVCVAILVVIFIKRRRFFVCVLCFVFAMLLPLVSVIIKTDSIKQNNSLNVENCLISGKIYKLNIQLSENSVHLFLTDVHLNYGETEKKFNGKFLVQINADNLDTSKLELGKIVSVYGKPTFYSLESMDDIDLSYISRGINAKCSTFSYYLKISDETSFGARDKIRNSVYNIFKKTDGFYTNIGFAMMFGETTVLESEVYDVFTDTGIAHLLAVSGFHISIIISFLSFILDKLKSRKDVKFIIILLILGFYAYICDFSVSVIRASVMSLLLLLGSARNKEYDRLSSLSFACCLILAINPLDLFSVSFILSFVAVLSIILLMPVFERLLSNIFYPKFASTLSLTLATSVGISVFQIYYFHTMPLLSFISNLVTVPLVSMLFIFVLLAVILGSLIGLAAPLVSVFGFGMKYILQFNYFISQIGINLHVGEISAVTLLISLLLMFAISDYVFLKRRYRVIISSVLAAALVLLIII